MSYCLLLLPISRLRGHRRAVYPRKGTSLTNGYMFLHTTHDVFSFYTTQTFVLFYFVFLPTFVGILGSWKISSSYW